MENTIELAALPVLSSSEFENSPKFTVVVNEKARLMTWQQLTQWIEDNVQGEKGDQGVAGTNGINGANGISATHSWSGTTLTITSASGTSSANLKGEKGDKGDKGDTGAAGSNGTNGTNGTNGSNGWTPVYATEQFSGKQLLKIIDWTGGTGTKPNVDVYLSSSGLTPNITLAQDFKGDKGDNGEDGLGVSSATFNSQNDLTITLTDSSYITATSTKKQGIIQYVDGVSQLTPQTFLAETKQVLENNATTTLGTLPNSWSFYVPSLNKINFPEVGFYSVTVEFDCTTTSLVHILMSLESIEDEDSVVAKARVITNGDFDPYTKLETTLYVNSSLVASGAFVKLYSDVALEAENVKYTIEKKS